jgi:hypothetical protein
MLRLVAVSLTLCCASGWAEDDFVWVDPTAALHHSARLADVPEPYAGMYRAQRADPNRPANGSAAAPTGGSASQPGVHAEAQRLQRQQIQAEVRRWRTELSHALGSLVEADKAFAEARFNPVLREVPSGREAAREAQQARDAAFVRLRMASRMLLVELPAQAQKAHLPPAWLQ